MKVCLICQHSHIEEVVQESRRYYFCRDCNKLYERCFDSRYGRMQNVATASGVTHMSVGGVVWDGSHMLLIKRRSYPFGYSFPAGHLEYHENPIDGFYRELKEETGIKVKNTKLIFEGELDWNKCRYGADSHMWYFYESHYQGGNPVMNSEIGGVAWYSPQEAGNLELSPVADFFLKNVIAK